MVEKRKTLNPIPVTRFVLVAILFVCNVSVALTDVHAQQGASPRQKTRIDLIIRTIQSDYKIVLAYKQLSKQSHSEKLVFSEPEQKDMQRLYGYINIFAEELQKYPKDFFHRYGLKKVYFVKKLFHNKKNAQGVYDAQRKVIYFNFNQKRGRELALRHNIHHELFHMIEMNVFNWKGPDWEAFNEEGFRYAKKGKVYIEPGRNKHNYFAPKRLGFVTHYAMSSVHEDKAEVYACLFIKSQHKLIHRWAKKDSILAMKIKYIKNFINEYSNHQITDQYWQQLWSNRKY